MPEPVLRVQLTAEGVAEVVAALQKVRSEAALTAAAGGRAGRGAGAGFLSFNGILASTRGLLGALGIALTAAQLIQFTTGAAKGTDELGRLSQGIGASIENINALKLVTKLSDQEISGLGKPLSRFVSNVVTESDKARGALQALGFSAKEITQLKAGDSVEMLDAISRKFAQIPDGPKKTAAAYALLRGEAADLIPVMNRLGSEGLEAAKQRVKELGLAVSDDLVKRISLLNDDLKTMELVAQGVAVQFVSGLAPSLQAILEAMQSGAKNSGKAWQEFGQVVGTVVKVIATFVVPIYTLFLNGAKAFGDYIGGVYSVYNALITKGPAAALDKGRERFALISRDYVNGFKKTFQVIKDIWAKPIGPQFGPAAPKLGGIDINKLTDAQSKAFRAGIDADLSYLRANLKLQLDAEDDRYRRGLLTIADHFAARRRLLEESLAKEVALLQKREISEASRGDAAAVKKTAGEIAEAHAKAANQQAKDDLEQADAVRAYASKQIEILAKTLDLQGQKHSAAILDLHDIDEEIAAQQRLLDLTLKSGGDFSEPANRIKALQDERDLMKKKIDFEEQSRQTNLALNDLARDRQVIQDKESAGTLAHIDAERQIAQLEESRLPKLREMAAQALNLAQIWKNPEAMAAAQDLVTTIDAIVDRVSTLKNEMKQFGANLKDASAENLATELDGINSKTVFWRQLLAGVFSDLRRIYAQLVANKIVAAASSFLGGFLGGTTAHEGARIQLKGPGQAQGGLLRGPGTGTSDSLLVRRSADEYVEPAARVREPGAFDLLEQLRTHGMASIRQLALKGAYERAKPPDPLMVALEKRGMTLSDYHALLMGELTWQLNPDFHRNDVLAQLDNPFKNAEITPAGAGRDRLEGRLDVGLEDGLVAQHIRKPKGEKAVLEVIAKNQRAIRGSLGIH